MPPKLHNGMGDAHAAALAEWRAATRCPTGEEQWRVEFFADATVVHVCVGCARADAVDVFIDERGVFVIAGHSSAECEFLRVAIPLPGALDSARPWARLEDGFVTVTLPRGEGEQQRVPISVRSSTTGAKSGESTEQAGRSHA